MKIYKSIQLKQSLQKYKLAWVIFIFSIIGIGATPFLTPSLGGNIGGFTMMLTLLCIFKYSITSALCKSALFLGFLLLFVYSITICFPLNDHRLKARRIKDCDNLREIWKSIEMFKNDCGIFPFALGHWTVVGCWIYQRFSCFNLPNTENRTTFKQQ